MHMRHATPPLSLDTPIPRLSSSPQKGPHDASLFKVAAFCSFSHTHTPPASSHHHLLLLLRLCLRLVSPTFVSWLCNAPSSIYLQCIPIHPSIHIYTYTHTPLTRASADSSSSFSPTTPVQLLEYTSNRACTETLFGKEEEKKALARNLSCHHSRPYPPTCYYSFLFRTSFHTITHTHLTRKQAAAGAPTTRIAKGKKPI